MMTLFETTPNILIAFTNTLIHSLWIGAIFFLFVKGILVSIGDQRSALRYRISILGLLLFMMSTASLFIYLYSPSSPVTAIGNELRLFYLQILPVDDTTGVTVPLYGLYPLILKLYLSGLVVLTLRWIISAMQIKKIIKKGELANRSSMELLQTLRSRLGIRKHIRLLLSEKLQAPVLFGFFKPVIIVPANMFFNLPPEQVESILLHELIHVKRLDFVINLMQTIFEVLFFFNPFTWLISKLIRSEREKYCDDYVIDFASSPSVYVKALFNLSLLSSNRYDLAVSAAGNKPHYLFKRIQRLLNSETMKTKNRQKVMLTYLVIVSLILILVSSGFSASLFTVEKGTKKETIVQTPSLSKKSPPPSIIPDTSDTKELLEMTEEEWKDYKKQREFEMQELKSIDWEEQQEKFEQMQQEIMADMEMDREQFELDMKQLKEDLKTLDKEKIQQELQIAIKELEYKIQDTLINVKEIEKALQESLHVLEEINLEQIRENVQSALVDIDLDFDFDFDKDIHINFDSIMNEVRMNIQEIDFEKIKQDIAESMLELEKELKEIEEKRSEAKHGTTGSSAKKE